MLATEGVKVLESPDLVQNKILSTSSVQYLYSIIHIWDMISYVSFWFLRFIVHSNGHRLSPIPQAIFDVSWNIGL